jgi:leucyl-tRNA synthetase
VVPEDHEFADELIEGLGELKHWPDKVKLMQENWIGKSQGLTFGFQVSNGETIEVFSTRPDTIFGASFVAVAADHPIAQALAGNPEVAASSRAASRAARPRPSWRRRKSWATTPASPRAHPFDSTQQLPVYIANFRADGVRHRRGDGRAGARPARPRFRAQVRPAGAARVAADADWMFDAGVSR